MSLQSFSLTNFRNFLTAKVDLAKCNLLFGVNGSGKTSFLEAIHYLGLGRSFRTRLPARIIRHTSIHFSLFAQIQQENHMLAIGVERRLDGVGRIRINQKNVNSLLELGKILPLQLLNTESRILLTGSSKLRRQFMDWGVFHVEPQFIHYWQQTQRVLKQRNAALKAHASATLIKLWDKELITVALLLSEFRRTYIEKFTPIFLQIAQIFLENYADISLNYKAGWNEALGLEAVLASTLPRDLQLGYTQAGPQRADLAIRINAIPAQDILSHGQQKLIVYALRLAQGTLLKNSLNTSCIYLLDDLSAELDEENRKKVIALLRTINAQLVVTGVERQSLKEFESFSNTKMFHVEHRENTIIDVT